jgi:hypothetical protein
MPACGIAWASKSRAEQPLWAQNKAGGYVPFGTCGAVQALGTAFAGAQISSAFQGMGYWAMKQGGGWNSASLFCAKKQDIL